MRYAELGAVVLALAACSSKSQPETKPEPVKTTPADAGIDGITVITGFDPSSGMHLDDDGSRRPAVPATGATRPGHPIDVTLRSSPSGAQVWVDGVLLGTTPAFWNGEANGREHEFEFSLSGFALARYRFVPITSGVIHARLEPIAEDVDAGVPGADLRPAPPPTRPAPPPPTTMVTPIDAAAAPLANDAGAAPVPGSGIGPPP